VWVATGDSGMGMTHGTIAGILLTDLIHGAQVRWADLYDPSRINLRAARTYAAENANVAAQYADWVRAGEVEGVDEIAPGDGAIVRRGVHRIAAYRDPQGMLHEMNARCTHLGCSVRWNATERSWDCPCHGSRFDALGEVLSGPAVAALKPMENPSGDDVRIARQRRESPPTPPPRP
jgi:Rieske Fe-S protein